MAASSSSASSGHSSLQWSNLLRRSCLLVALMTLALPELIAALKDVSVTIPQAVKRGSNALLVCNYDMENDTLYSVKWYKGRREFYRYTPKENPAMKVFASITGLNVERTLSNQSQLVLLAVPLSISGKFTCEISVDAPSFQTDMVSGDLEVVELPEEQASVTGIQARYRIGDLVDGNCSIKFSKPAANLTWTINGVVVPPHHIKTYQTERYEENNLESVLSTIHFMVTTQHFLKGQMRLKCTASIFDIFKEEIESVIEEDRPRIMASGRSYNMNNYPYDHHGSGDGFEDHNESYLTYYSAADTISAASSNTDFFLRPLQRRWQRICRATKANVIALAGSMQRCAKRAVRLLTAQIESVLATVADSWWQQRCAVLCSCISGAAIILLLTRQQRGRCQNAKAVETRGGRSRAAEAHLSADVALSKATASACSKSFYNCHAPIAHTEPGAAALGQKQQPGCCHSLQNQNGGSALFAVCQQLSVTIARIRNENGIPAAAAPSSQVACNFLPLLLLLPRRLHVPKDQAILMALPLYQCCCC